VRLGKLAGALLERHLLASELEHGDASVCLSA
jgi:hypothetical protein